MTNWTFDDTIPATNNNPSNDQPGMLDNNISTLGIIGEDHVTFNLNNGGQHTAIHFNQDNSYVPTFPLAAPTMFTNIVGSLPQLFYWSGTAAQSQDQYVNASPGSTFLFGGNIIKWGTAGIGTFATTISFVNAFPNACFAVFTTNNVASSAVVSVTSVTASNFVARATSVVTTYYIAIGY